MTKQLTVALYPLHEYVRMKEQVLLLLGIIFKVFHKREVPSFPFI